MKYYSRNYNNDSLRSQPLEKEVGHCKESQSLFNLLQCSKLLSIFLLTLP